MDIENLKFNHIKVNVTLPILARLVLCLRCRIQKFSISTVRPLARPIAPGQSLRVNTP